MAAQAAGLRVIRRGRSASPSSRAAKSVAHDPGDGLELAPARGFELPLRVVQAMDDGNQVKSPGTVSEGHRLARTQKSNVHAYMLSSSRASTSSCSAGESLGVNQRWATTVGTTAEPMTTASSIENCTRSMMPA